MRKKFIMILVVVMTFLLLLTGCGTRDIDQSGPGGNIGNETDSDDKDGKDGASDDASDTGEGNSDRDDLGEDVNEIIFEAEIIENGESLLIAPDPESNEGRSSDKMYVGLTGASIMNKSGEDITKEELKPGDIIKITYNGIILESYPAQIGASKVEVIDHNLVIDGYMAIIDDIYQKDPGLNGDIEMIALDTTGWVELTQIEKEMIFSMMTEKYGMEVIDKTYEQLVEEGLVDKENLYFPKGILIDIENIKINDEKNKITYKISKWRSGLGAIGSDDVTAEFDGSEWEITMDNMWIS